MNAPHIGLPEYLHAKFEAIEQRFVDSDRLLQAALVARLREVDMAHSALEKRLDGMNEFRAQLGDQGRMMMPRIETERLYSVLEDKINVNNRRIDVLLKSLDAIANRKEGLNQGWIILLSSVAAVTAIVSAVAVVLKS